MSHVPAALDAEIEGAVNLRDVGALPAGEGRRVRAGHLYRSGMTHRIGPDGLARLAGRHGVRTVIDLRTEDERAWAGVSPFAEHGIALHHAPMEDPADRDREFRKTKLASFREGTWDWVDVYRRMADTSRGSLGRALRLVAVDAELPVVVHCAAGRDRTGVTVALLLHAVGVDREVIADDYGRSGANLVAQVDAFIPADAPHFPLSRAELERILDTDRRDLLRFLDALEAEHGSLDRFLDLCGLDAPARASLRERLTEPG